MTPATLEEELEVGLDAVEELRAQYVACSYLATACQDALGRFPTPAYEADGGRIAQRALEFMLAVEWDWRQTLQELAEKLARATSVAARPGLENLRIVGNGNGAHADTPHLQPVTYSHAEDSGAAGEGAPRHRPDYRRRPSVRRRL